MKMRVITALTFTAVSFGPSCGPERKEFDPSLAKATPERPPATEVDFVSIPEDPALPRWVVTVEPFEVAASGVTSGTGWQAGAPPGMTVTDPHPRIGYGIQSQLLSALSRAGNITVVDYQTYPVKVQPGERGPYIIRGTVTEYNETAGLTGRGESDSGLAWNLVPYAGPIIAFGVGSKSVQETERTGLVGLDLRLVDGQSGRLIASFVVEGSFTASGQVTTRTSWGKTKTSTEYAASALGQAQRVAINKAVMEIHSILSKLSAER